MSDLTYRVHDRGYPVDPGGFADVPAAPMSSAATRTATSVSLNRIGPGILFFTLDRSVNWPVGTPVHITATPDPNPAPDSNRTITGMMTVAQGQLTKSISVRVTACEGVGTLDSWTVLALFFIATGGPQGDSDEATDYISRSPLFDGAADPKEQP